tara:strand:+ start:44268 stop:44447 length:180 start_codon:yes stop_codon:yes gene_type:complete
MKKKYLFTILIAVFYSIIANCQGFPPPPPPPPPPGLPIDGGLIFLFIASLVYGIKKIRD